MQLMLQYLLPGLIPSWRFFDYIAPSPRIEYAIVANADDPPIEWREFRSRPAHLSVASMLCRLLWNPIGNESLYMSSCAEKLMVGPSALHEDELLTRIAHALADDETGKKNVGSADLLFRVVVVKREGAALTRRVGFVSARRKIATT